ncbi:MAG: O-antigen ligase family protein [Pirellulales bacterium]|nr:O-antigen ligase family protein [Pirellulales bacterium]
MPVLKRHSSPPINVLINSLLRWIRQGCLWIAAMIVMSLPIVVAADFGGVLWWTQYAAAMAVAAAAVLAITALLAPGGSVSPKQHALLWPCLAWAVYAWLQSLPLPGSLVGWLSPASQAAYTQWIEPFVSSSQAPAYYSVSLSALDTRHAAAILTLLVGLVWAVPLIFQTRSRVAAFLCVVALGSALHAGFGIYRVMAPGTLVWGTDIGQATFGSFVNPNNAALLLNLGLATSFGLLAWRLMALTGQEVDDPNFELNDLLALIRDRESFIGMIAAVLCVTGLLVCGSRGGVVAAVGGVLLALGWLRQRRGFMTVPVVGGALLLGVGLLVVPLNLNLQSLTDFQGMSTDSSTLLRDGRLNHWRDGWVTALAHLPAGSGLATYSYAYLPFQETSSKAWYHHADNLWLEMITETGLVGLLLSGWILWVLLQTLQRLGQSADPIDHGLRVAGWYAVGSIALSQCFDFGLIIPANLLLATTLFSIIVARDAQSNVAAQTASRRSLFRSTRPSVAVGVTALMALLAVGLAGYRLHQDAERESILKTAEAELDAVRGDIEALDAWIKRLQIEIGDTDWPQARDLLCEFEHRRIRLAEVTAAQPETEEQALEAYRATRPLDRRQGWCQTVLTMTPKEIESTGSLGFSPDPADQPYREILENSARSLVSLPLGPDARKWQLYLDFAHRDFKRSQAALAQLTQFYRSNAQVLVRLAAFAGDCGENERAVALLQAALRISPNYTRRALELTERWPAVSLEQVLIDTPEIWREAAIYLLGREQPNDSLLKKCLAGLHCDRCTTKTSRSNCEILAADLAYKLKDFELAFEHYEFAVKLRPADADLRLRYLVRLKTTGRRNDARQQALMAREIFPEDKRFESFIKEMAAEDRQVPLRPLTED